MQPLWKETPCSVWNLCSCFERQGHCRMGASAACSLRLGGPHSSRSLTALQCTPFLLIVNVQSQAHTPKGDRECQVGMPAYYQMSLSLCGCMSVCASTHVYRRIWGSEDHRDASSGTVLFILFFFNDGVTRSREAHPSKLNCLSREHLGPTCAHFLSSGIANSTLPHLMLLCVFM